MGYPIAFIFIPGTLIAAFGLLLPRHWWFTWIATACATSLGFFLSTRDFREGGPADAAFAVGFMTLLFSSVIMFVKRAS